MIELTKVQQEILAATGYQLVTGGPGSGKTTVSILKAAAAARVDLGPEQRLLFLSFARATVGRVIEAIVEEKSVTLAERRLIEVDTYHSFFWRILKSHGYLIGLPRKISVLTPSAQAIALSVIRSNFGPLKKLSEAGKAARYQAEEAELSRLAKTEGLVCFDFFAPMVGQLLQGSAKIRKLVSTIYPVIILDEFQDTSAGQWDVVKELGEHSTLIALADPEQRIFDFIGADPERLDHFKAAFKPSVHDLSQENHRSRGTDIARFGNDILSGQFRPGEYQGVEIVRYPHNQAQAYTALVTTTLEVRRRLIEAGPTNWSLAVLVPTKKMTRTISDLFHFPGVAGLPIIDHSAVMDMEGPLLAAEIVAFLLQQGSEASDFAELTDLMCRYYHGCHGSEPTKGDLSEAAKIRTALEKRDANLKKGKAPAANNILNATHQVFRDSQAVALTGDPDKDWSAMRKVLEDCGCARLVRIAEDVRNVRLLRKGTQLRLLLKQDWHEFGGYRNALEVTRQSFVQEHFANAGKPETGVVVMNMHKAKGKQFDEVILFEGWPHVYQGQIMANTGRFVRKNEHIPDLGPARQNFRVSVTRAKKRTTIMTPNYNPCILLPNEDE